jgi:hypothetical protein
MKQKLTMLSAALAVGFLLVGPASAAPDNPPGFTQNPVGGGGSACGNCGGHGKNGGHHKNGGGGNGGGGGGSGGTSFFACVVGDKVYQAISVKHCRRLVARYSYSTSYSSYHDEGYEVRRHREVSRATRMQMKKRYAKRHHGRKVAKHRRGGGYGGGKVIIVNNYGGYVEVNKNGGY